MTLGIYDLCPDRREMYRNPNLADVGAAIIITFHCMRLAFLFVWRHGSASLPCCELKHLCCSFWPCHHDRP